MIHAYFDDKNMEGVLKHLSAENFTFVGVTKDAVFNSKKTYREYAESFLEDINTYEIIEENYSVASESQDSCLVIVKLKSIDTRTQNICELNYFFCFNQLGNRIICPHYHVSRPFTANKVVKSVFFNENMPPPELPFEVLLYNEELISFMNSAELAMKSFYYEKNFPYRYVNRRYMELLGYSTIREFVTEQNYSSLVNIHAADQNRYVEYLQAHHAAKIGNRTFEQKYKYQSTYYLIYRIQSPFLAEDVSVLEWGNFFTQGGRTIVNCFILNLNDVAQLSLRTKSQDTFPHLPCGELNSAYTDCGMHVSQNIIVYPRNRRIKIDNETIELTPVECDIFLVLLERLNRPVTVDEIYVNIWNNEELHLTSNTLPMHISNIRRKLKVHEQAIRLVYIKNEGYCLRVN